LLAIIDPGQFAEADEKLADLAQLQGVEQAQQLQALLMPHLLRRLAASFGL